MSSLALFYRVVIILTKNSSKSLNMIQDSLVCTFKRCRKMDVVWTTLVLYMGAMLGISVYARKYIKTSADFLVAGRRLGLALTTATLAATHYGGGFHLRRS